MDLTGRKSKAAVRLKTLGKRPSRAFPASCGSLHSLASGPAAPWPCHLSHMAFSCFPASISPSVSPRVSSEASAVTCSRHLCHRTSQIHRFQESGGGIVGVFVPLPPVAVAWWSVLFFFPQLL